MKPSDESQVFLSSDSKNQVELVEKEASSAKIFSVSSKEDEDISFEITPKDKTSKIKSLSVKESTLVQQGSSQKLQVTLDLIIDQANPQDQVLAQLEDLIRTGKPQSQHRRMAQHHRQMYAPHEHEPAQHQKHKFREVVVPVEKKD